MKVTQSLYNPELICNHFKFRHYVNDYNDKRYEYWPHRPFSFLLAIMEVNANLAEAYFVCQKVHKPQLEFRTFIPKDIKHNKYLIEDQSIYEFCRS